MAQDANRVEIELAARDTSGPVLNQFGATVKRTFEQTSQDAAQASKNTSLLDRTFGNLADTVRAVGVAFGAYEAVRYAQQAVMLAARYETLGVTLGQLGKTAGYSQAYLDQQEESLRKAGITAIGARESLARMVQANLDLSKSAQLARVAQDAAAISGVNSSEAYKQIVYGIQSAQVEMLRTVGINVSFENSYAAVAAQTGRTADSLNETEKAGIRLSAVLEAGKGIAGSYEAAMGTAGKQLLSFQRYAEDLQVELGKAFGPALTSIVSQSVQSIGELTRAVSESAQSGALLSVGQGLQWVADHSTVVVTALLGVAAVMAAVKAEAWLLDGGLSRLSGTIDKTVRAAGTGLTSAFSLHPMITAATVLMTVATAAVYLADKLGLTDDAMRRQAESAARASREYSSLKDTVDGVAGPIQQYQVAVAKANGDQQKQLEALKGLNAVFPELTGEYHSAAEGLANVNANLERFLVLKRAELEMLKEKAEKEQSDRLANLARLYEEATAKMERSQRSMYAAFQRNQAGAHDQIWSEDKKWADEMRDLYIEAGKVASVKGISQELRDSATDLQGKASLATKAVLGLKEAMRMLGLEVKNVQAPLAQVAIFPQLNMGDKRVSGELYKLGDEVQKAVMSPTQARLFEINQEVAKQTQELWTNNPTAEVARAGEAQIQAWANAQRAALAPEMAKTKAEWARGLYDIGAATREQLLANMQAEAGVLAAGGERTRGQYLQTQKAITDLTLQGYRDRQSITEAGFNLGREGQGALIAAYQAELAILPALKMSAEDRARRELELATKIRDVKEQGAAWELDLEKQRVAWMAEGTAKQKALLELQEKEERQSIESRFKANADAQEKKKALLDDYEKYAQRRREDAASKERQQALDVQLQTAKLYGNTRLAKELELAKYAETLKTSGVNEIYHAQLIANERVRINRTGIESMLLQWSDFYEGWDKIGENFLQNVQGDIASSFKSAFEGTTTLWEGMWNSMKDISYQALAAISTKLLTYGMGQVAISILPGLAGPLGMASGTGGLGSILSLASGAKSAYGLFSGPGLSTLGEYGGLGSSLFNWGPGATGFTEGGWEMATPLQTTGLSGLGYGVSGVGGALTGWQLAQMLYGSGTWGQVGGAVGGAAGGIGGAMLGTMVLPGVGTAIGALLGGALGGAGIGGLGSLFDSEDDTPDWAKPGKPQAHLDELNKRLDDYIQRLKDGKLSQDEFYGSLAELAPLFAGTNDLMGGYGDTIGGTIEAMQGLTAGTQEYTDKLTNELNPAWIISTGLAKDLAAGMNELEAHKKALTNAVDAYAASNSLSASQQEALLDLIIREKGNVAELTADYNRYNEIRDMFLDGTVRGKEELAALGEEFRGLHDKLKITSPMDNMVTAINKLVDSLTKVFNLPSEKEFNFAVNYSSSGSPSYGGGYSGGGESSGGGGGGGGSDQVSSIGSQLLGRDWSIPSDWPTGLSVDQYTTMIQGSDEYLSKHHDGGMVGRMHNGGTLASDEVLRILQLGEHVTKRASVTPETLPWLTYINSHGALPLPQAPAGMDDFLTDFRSSLALRNLTASASAPAAPAAQAAPVFNLHLDFSGASFGSDPEETAQLVGEVAEDRMRQVLADWGNRGEDPVVRHSKAVSR
ncbi:MAG: hypothetical protein V1806_03765 [Pseudomonadota bacterium]